MSPAGIFDESSAAKPRLDDDIDVVIPVFNGERYIPDCIGSVLSQTLKPRRIIVVDDGSTDKTAELVVSLIESNPSVMLHRMGRNAGVSAARNAGIRFSDAPFVAFVDADDVWAPNKLELQLQVFRSSQQSVGFVHSSFFLIDQMGNVLSQGNGNPLLLQGNIFSRLLQEGNVLSGSASSVMIRRDILDRVGLFDEQLHYGEDWDLWLRLASVSEVGHTPEAVVGIRVHPGSAQKDGNHINRFLQVVEIYSRWEKSVSEDVIRQLRKNGLFVLVTSAHSFQEADLFYRTLSGSKANLARNLYGGKLDFWFGFLRMEIQTLRVGFSQMVVGKIRHYLRDLGWIA